MSSIPVENIITAFRLCRSILPLTKLATPRTLPCSYVPSGLKTLRSSPFQIRSTNQGQVQNTPLYRSSDVSSWVAPHRRVPKLEYIGSVTLRWPRQDHKDELLFFADPAYPRAHRFDFTLNPLFASCEEILLDMTDAVTILDVCYVGIATQSSG